MRAREVKTLSVREQSILLGLYLSKFDVEGISALGFSSFVEVYNTFALAIGTKPATIKNYRDELDPYFPNARKGWHQRPLREHCAKIFDEFKEVDIGTLQNMVCNWVSVPLTEDETLSQDQDSTFAKRLITGKAAENFFIQNYSKERVFQATELVDVTQTGCGYDFRLHEKTNDVSFAVEVKGLRMSSGSLAMTDKEYRVANEIGDRYFLYVVKNFEEIPMAINIRNPLKSSLDFNKYERLVTQVS
jgi:hypothetical protein